MTGGQDREEEEPKGKRGRAGRKEEETYLNRSLCPYIPRPLTFPSGINRKNNG